MARSSALVDASNLARFNRAAHITTTDCVFVSLFKQYVSLSLSPWAAFLYKKFSRKAQRKLKLKHKNFQMVRRYKDKSGVPRVHRTQVDQSQNHKFIQFICPSILKQEFRSKLSSIKHSPRQGGKHMKKSAIYPLKYGRKVRDLHQKWVVP